MSDCIVLATNIALLTTGAASMCNNESLSPQAVSLPDAVIYTHTTPLCSADSTDVPFVCPVPHVAHMCLLLDGQAAHSVTSRRRCSVPPCLSHVDE